MRYYVCDKKKECNISDYCGGQYCNHTSDITHALYETHFDFNKAGRDRIEVIRDVNDYFKGARNEQSE